MCIQDYTRRACLQCCTCLLSSARPAASQLLHMRMGYPIKSCAGAPLSTAGAANALVHRCRCVRVPAAAAASQR
eukprot:6719721-Alexandrium_andersonii.AAC.1